MNSDNLTTSRLCAFVANKSTAFQAGFCRRFTPQNKFCGYENSAFQARNIPRIGIRTAAPSDVSECSERSVLTIFNQLFDVNSAFSRFDVLFRTVSLGTSLIFFQINKIPRNTGFRICASTAVVTLQSIFRISGRTHVISVQFIGIQNINEIHVMF